MEELTREDLYTYQDLLEATGKMQFVRNAIVKHENSKEFKIAKDAEEYYKHRNVTITNYQKLLYTITGKAVPDNYNANYKMASKFFYRFVTQENQYLLGKGATWEKDSTGKNLGDDFDNKLQKIGRYSLVEGVGFGFWNLDHIEVFPFTEFVPLYDEQTGALRAGVRYWQISKNKPLRATLYEEDGYTEYVWDSRISAYDEGNVLKEKTAYVIHTESTEADGTTLVYGENYPSFPIVPLYGNDSHQSEFVGLREQIDCYDLIKSGFANTVDEASIIYWTLQNAGGMDDVDLAKFVERLKTIHAVNVDDEVTAEPHTLEPSYQAREALLDRLRADLYEDAMALDTKALASGGSVVTAVIKAAYEPLDSKCNEYEYQVKEFIKGILALAGIEDNVTFTRSKIINSQEEIGTLLTASQYLSPEYLTTKILTILGDGDQAEKMLDEMEQNEIDQFNDKTQNGNSDARDTTRTSEEPRNE